MLLELFSMDIGPDDLAAQLPVRIETLRQIPGPDHSGYWLARCNRPVHWGEKAVNYLVVVPRFVGDAITPDKSNIALNVAYVTDESVLDDDLLCFDKASYVAICDSVVPII